MFRQEAKIIKKESQYGIKNREHLIILVVHAIHDGAQVFIGETLLFGIESCSRQSQFTGQLGCPDQVATKW
jgi:hypothetical protein